MRRKERRMPMATRRKIADTMRGQKKASETKQKISEAMKRYWAKLPYIRKEENNE